MFMRVVVEIIEVILIVLLIRFALRYILSSVNQRRRSPPFPRRSDATAPPSSGPPEISRELKKDPQCGSYVSTELSLKSRHRGEILHFCSRQCQEQFFSKEQVTGNRG